MSLYHICFILESIAKPIFPVLEDLRLCYVKQNLNISRLLSKTGKTKKIEKNVYLLIEQSKLNYRGKLIANYSKGQ